MRQYDEIKRSKRMVPSGEKYCGLLKGRRNSPPITPKIDTIEPR